MRSFLVLALVLAFAVILPAQVAGDFEDDGDHVTLNGTQIRACFEHALMRGVDFANDRFMCSEGTNTGAIAVDPALPGGTQASIFFRGIGHQVHVCPTGSAMVGWDRQRGWLVCAPALGLTNIHPDLNTQELEPNQNKGQKMHVCDSNNVMVGISEADNVLICASHP